MSSTSSTAYRKLKELSKKGAVLDSIHNLLEWDQETYMPKNAIHLRAKQLEVMASLSHSAKRSASFKKSLSSLIDLTTGQIKEDNLTEEMQAECREWRRDFLHASKLPEKFVKQFAKTTSEAIHIWAEAKKNNRFEHFLPHLQKVVELCRKKSELLGYDKHPYDSLIDLYEPGMNSHTLDALFDRLKGSLTHLLQEIQSKNKAKPPTFSHPFSTAKQLHFSQRILHALGLTEEMSRLDLSSHPFCNALCPSDVRMTTRIIPNNPLSCIFSVIHEAGHGLYEAQLNPEHFGSPLGCSVSLGIHESQSRLWETIIGKSYPFWQHFYPLLQEEFHSELSNFNLDEFYLAINHVSPSLIRTESDEVTYCLHIILRYEIEKGLIDGSLQAKDIPWIWSEKMRQYLGIVPSFDTEGCLQDIHWSMGGMGYFPTYALGNLYAAQFFHSFCQTHSQWASDLKNGNMDPLKKWLKTNIHTHGRRYLPQELVKIVTTRPLDETFYINYLQDKFKKIYR